MPVERGIDIDADVGMSTTDDECKTVERDMGIDADVGMGTTAELELDPHSFISSQ